MALHLGLKKGVKIHIGNDIVVTLSEKSSSGSPALSITAPKRIKVWRDPDPRERLKDHCCPDWDFGLIKPGTPEWSCRTCNKMLAAEIK